MTNVIPITELNVFQFLRQIIMHELDLADVRVMIFNQRWQIPTYDYMFVVLSCQPSKVLSNRNTQKPNTQSGEYEEIQDLTILEHIIISPMSKNMEAFSRKEEIVAALNSIYSQQLQAKNSFKILNANPPIEDLTLLEGAAQLYRYDIPVFISTWFQKKKKVDFYDQFPLEVRMNDGTPDIVERTTPTP